MQQHRSESDEYRIATSVTAKQNHSYLSYTTNDIMNTHNYKNMKIKTVILFFKK